jgi:hypothetical protein
MRPFEELREISPWRLVRKAAVVDDRSIDAGGDGLGEE